MHVNVTLIDPASYKWAYFLTDTCRTICAGVRALGHPCDLTINHVAKGALNIIVGTHLLAKSDIDTILATGVRYVVVQTEALSTDPATGLTRSSYSGEDFRTLFGELFRRATAVWECLDSNIPLVERLGVSRERIRLYEPGFHEDLIDVRHRPLADKDLDVLFFGSLPPYRQEVVYPLGEKLRVQLLFDAPSAFRNDMLARTKINLVLQASPELTFLSPQRVGYLLNNRCFIVAESPREGGPLDDLVCRIPRPDLTRACEEFAKRDDLQELADAAFERYRERPMSAVMARLLD